ncbi:MAG: 3-isopropylmalate dehydratase large subunit, partial [Promethearchaeota archaeon]
TVNGATDYVLEFTGETISNFNMEERMTISNMAVEAGATSGIINPDMVTVNYLWPFIKDEFKSKEDALKEYSKWSSDPDAHYEKTYDIDVSGLEPLITIKYTPDQVIKASEGKDIKIDQAYIGSCTNGRITDLREAAKILKGRRISDNVRGILAPATTQVYRQALKEGIIDIFLDAGFLVSNPTCGACLGMSNGVLALGEVAVSSTNRNFNGRMGKGGMLHLASPATCAASAINGHITDPREFL